MFNDPAVAAALTPPTLTLLLAGAFFGAIAAGGAGFAFALVASAIWLHALTPVQTTFLVVACGLLLHVTLIWPARRGIETARLWPFLAGGLIGAPLGVRLLTHTDAGTLKLGLGLFLAAYGIYALAAPRLPAITGGGRIADGAVGFAGGVLAGLGGYSGVLPAIWTQLRGWPKEIARGVYQPFILFGHTVTLLLVGFVAFDKTAAALLLLSLPALAAGAFVGWRIYGRLDETRFRQVIAAVLAVSGLALVF
jgi:uncharacterized membrane protein YfcA